MNLISIFNVHGNQFGRIKEEGNKKNKNRRKQKNKKKGLSCARSRHTAKHKALPCAPDLAHGKVNFKFRKQSRMKKLPKRKL